MHSAPANTDVSDAVAVFLTATHAGPSYDAALKKAHTLLRAARTVTADAIVERALRANGNVLRSAAALATAFAGDATLRDSAAVLGAALAAGRLTAASDDAVATAIALGCELQRRIHRSVGGADFDAVWNADSAVGIFGAVAAAVSVTNLDVAQAHHALGLAATQSAGVAAVSGRSAQIATGKAAADAVEAAILARHGFTSSAAAIEGRRGFAALMSRRFDARAIVTGLGTDWS